MPNYSAMGRTALNMQCPHCDNYNEHRTEKTDPGHYRWSDEATPLFKRISGQDLSFRQRTKRCVKCERTFIAIEMSKNYLRDMVTTLIRDEKHITLLQSQKKAFVEEIKSLQARLHTIQKLAVIEKKA